MAMRIQGGTLQLEQGEILLRKSLMEFPPSSCGKPHLIASRCKKCGDLAFPPKERCGICDETQMEKTLLSNRGKVYSYTIVRQAVPGYALPNIVAIVKIPEDNSLMIFSQIKECPVEKIKIDMEVETIIDELYTSTSGQKVIGYAFKPVSREK